MNYSLSKAAITLAAYRWLDVPISTNAKVFQAKRTRISRGHLRYDFSDGSVLQTSGHGKNYTAWVGEGAKS